MAVTTPEIPRVAARVDARSARIGAPRSGTALVVALLAACTYAVFAHGAVGLPEEPRLQIGVALVAALTSGAWLFSGTIVLRAPAQAWIALGLLALFAAWCGISLIWTVTPDRTWAELNRGIAYSLVLVLGIAAGASAPKVLERVAVGYLVMAVTCAGYALGGKFVPGIDFLGVVNFDHTGLASRLRAPLEYWNALALVSVMAVPVAMRLATDTARTATVRLAGLGGLYVLLACITMSYSRGGILATFVVVAVLTAYGSARLRGLAVFAVASTATIPLISLAFSRPALTGVGVPLDERIPDGAVLLLVFLGCLVGLLIAGWGMLCAEARIAWGPARSAKFWRRTRRVAIGFAIVWFLGAASGPGGIGGTFDRAWEDFSKTSKDEVSDPGRIVSSNSGNRWVWWKEAFGAWSDKPLEGWGAGSFPVTHKAYRDIELGVVQPHSVPLQFLAENGLVGALLAMGGIGLLLWAAAIAVRGSPRGRERDLAVALFAAAIAWVVHSFYDWDWDIPGVTVPALLFLGVLAGVARSPARTGGRPAPVGPGHATAARAVALVSACLLLALVMVSAVLPAWADSKATSALAISTDAGDDELEDAAARAETASRLDPTALRGLLAAASIAEGRGRLVDARGHLVDAVERQPHATVAWQRLLALALKTADRRTAQGAAERLLELDPIGTRTRQLVSGLELFRVPGSSSPTATGTPLSPKAVLPGEEPEPAALQPGPTATTGTGAPDGGAPPKRAARPEERTPSKSVEPSPSTTGKQTPPTYSLDLNDPDGTLQKDP